MPLLVEPLSLDSGHRYRLRKIQTCPVEKAWLEESPVGVRLALGHCGFPLLPRLQGELSL